MENTISLIDVLEQLDELMRELRVRLDALGAQGALAEARWTSVKLAPSLFGNGAVSAAHAAYIVRTALLTDAAVTDPAFWETSLGRVLAYFGRDAMPEEISRLCAAHALGVSRTRIGQLIFDGKLLAAPDGVTRESLAERMRDMFTLDLNWD